MGQVGYIKKNYETPPPAVYWYDDNQVRLYNPNKRVNDDVFQGCIKNVKIKL